MKVLHVREPEVGGVKTIIEQYIDNTPDIDHVVARLSTRRSRIVRIGREDVTGEFDDLDVPPQVAIRRLVSETRPDIIHAHSSWAGVHVRTTPALRIPIAYTPHCFAFERTDVSPLVRRSIQLVEAGLLARTSVLAAASRREHSIARRLRRSSSCAFEIVPHSAGPAGHAARSLGPHSPTVAAIGRVCTQKRPDLFEQLVKATHGRLDGVEFAWLGGGSVTEEASLRSCGVDVTGWLAQPELMRRLEEVDLLIHVADWEVGDPLVAIEAAARGIPVLYRRTPSAEFNLVGTGFDDMSALAAAVESILTSPTRYRELSTEALGQAALFDDETQRARLTRVYSTALERAGDRSVVG